MNRQKSEPRIRPFTYVLLIVTMMIVAAGGVIHAIYKNRQVQVKREIDAIERRIGQYRSEIAGTQVRADRLLNRFAIRQQLKSAGSPLRPIPVGYTEEVKANPPGEVATIHP